MPKRAKKKPVEPAVTGENPELNEPQVWRTCESWAKNEFFLSPNTLNRRLRRAGQESRNGLFSTAQVLRAMYGPIDEHRELLNKAKVEVYLRELQQMQRTHARTQDLQSAQAAFQNATIEALQELVPSGHIEEVLANLGIAPPHRSEREP